MGVTIFYRGRAADQASVDRVLEAAAEFARTRRWPAIPSSNSLLLEPPRNCETLDITFDERLAFEGAVKTQFAGPAVHRQIIELLRALREHLADLEVDDEAGAWDGASQRDVAETFVRTAGRIALRTRSGRKRLAVALSWALAGVAALIGAAFLYSWFAGLL
jgi:hypothetical protein